MFAVDEIDDVVAGLRSHGAELVGEVAQYEDIYRLCFLRGPEGISIGPASSSAETSMVRPGAARTVLAIARSVAVRRSARTSAISTHVRATVRIAAPDGFRQTHCVDQRDCP